jgi:hypothetical protein
MEQEEQEQNKEDGRDEANGIRRKGADGKTRRRLQTRTQKIIKVGRGSRKKS